MVKQNINTPAYWDSKYSGDNIENMYVDIYKVQMYDWILSNIAASANIQIVDVGCGNGVFESYMCDKKQINNMDIVGVDFSQIVINRNKQFFKAHKNVAFWKNDLSSPWMMVNMFHYVVCIEVLEHISDYENFLATLSRICKPEGKIFLSVPNRESIVSEEHVNIFSNSQMHELLRKFGTNVTPKLINNMVANNVRYLLYSYSPIKIQETVKSNRKGVKHG